MKFVGVVVVSVLLCGPANAAGCFGYTGPGGACYSGPGGGLYTGPGGGVYTGPPSEDSDAYHGPFGPCITGAAKNSWLASNCPNRRQ
jgi:hypothetical protein